MWGKFLPKLGKNRETVDAPKQRSNLAVSEEKQLGKQSKQGAAKRLNRGCTRTGRLGDDDTVFRI